MSAIAPYFPINPADWRRSADTVPILLSTFHGTVATVPGTIGCYRLHTAASKRSGLLGNKDHAFGPALAQTQRRRDLVAAWGTRCTGIQWPQTPLMLPWDWRLRALSWRRARHEQPYPNHQPRANRRGLNDALAHWPGYTVLERQVQRAWVAFVRGAPRPLVAALAPSNLSGRLRRALKGVRKAYP